MFFCFLKYEIMLQRKSETKVNKSKQSWILFKLFINKEVITVQLEEWKILLHKAN